MTEPNLLQQASAEREALIASVLPRAVAIAVSRRRVLSGIHWRGSLIVTAAEALGGADRVRIWARRGTVAHDARSDDARADDAASPDGTVGEVIASDLTTDVAVIRASGTFSSDVSTRSAPGHSAPDAATRPSPSETAGTSPDTTTRSGLRLGESVLIVGHDARGPIASAGIVSVAGPAWRSRRGGDIDQRLELAARVDGRLEGALVADMAGRSAAMLVCGPRGRALGIPAPTIERVVQAIEQHGYLPRPYLGIRLQTLWLDSTAATRFGRRSRRIPVVAGVEIGSPAAGAGLEAGDLIEALDGEEIGGVDDLMRALAPARIGGAIQVSIRRGGEAQTRTITVGEYPRQAP